jgi:hypothetical protein
LGDFHKIALNYGKMVVVEMVVAAADTSADRRQLIAYGFRQKDRVIEHGAVLRCNHEAGMPQPFDFS